MGWKDKNVFYKIHKEEVIMRFYENENEEEEIEITEYDEDTDLCNSCYCVDES